MLFLATVAPVSTASSAASSLSIAIVSSCCDGKSSVKASAGCPFTFFLALRRRRLVFFTASSTGSPVPSMVGGSGGDGCSSAGSLCAAESSAGFFFLRRRRLLFLTKLSSGSSASLVISASPGATAAPCGTGATSANVVASDSSTFFFVLRRRRDFLAGAATSADSGTAGSSPIASDSGLRTSSCSALSTVNPIASAIVILLLRLLRLFFLTGSTASESPGGRSTIGGRPSSGSSSSISGSHNNPAMALSLASRELGGSATFVMANFSTISGVISSAVIVANSDSVSPLSSLTDLRGSRRCRFGSAERCSAFLPSRIENTSGCIPSTVSTVNSIPSSASSSGKAVFAAKVSAMRGCI